MLEVFLHAALLGLGLVLLLVGGHWLVAGAVEIATRLGLSTLTIGLTIVAVGTSSPELCFNVLAAVNDNAELAFGNVTGSNIANIGLVLGTGAMLSPLVVHSRIIRRELPWLGVVTFFMVVAPFVPALRTGDETLHAYPWIAGVIMLGGLVGLLWYWLQQGRRTVPDPLRAEMAELERTAAAPIEKKLGRAVLVFGIGLAGLVGGGLLAEKGAVGVAAGLGLSQAVIGLTVVAICTSLPELATTIAACRKGHSDLAMGNVIGSNLFNVLLVLGLTSLIRPVPVPGSDVFVSFVSATGAQDLLMMLLLTVLIYPLAATGRQRLSRLEGVLLGTLWVAYMSWSVAREKWVVDAAASLAGGS